MQIRALPLAVVCLAALLPLHAQEKKDGTPGSGLYKVEINFRDGNDSGAMTDRRYALLMTDSRKATFKVGSKNPVVSGSIQPSVSGSNVETQITYLDIGVNIECIVHESGGRAMFHGSLDMSNVAGNEAVGGVRNPTIKQTRLELDATMDFAKPTLIASIDDPLTARKLQVEATITRVN